MASDQTVHLFMGTEVAERVFAYTEENWNADDETLTSEFSIEFFGGWIDHDFFELLTEPQLVTPGELARKTSYANWFDGDATAAAERLGIESANVIIAVYEDTPANALAPGARAVSLDLTYLGGFEYSSKRQTHGDPERTDGHGCRVLTMCSIGHFVYSGDFEGGLRRWRLGGDGRTLDASLDVPISGPIMQIRAIPSGVVACANGVIFWPDTGEGRVVSTLAGYQVLDIAVHPDGDTVVAAQAGSKVIALSLQSGAEIARFETVGRVWSVDFDDDVVVAGDSGGKHYRWRIGEEAPFDVADGFTTWKPFVRCQGRSFIASGDVVDAADEIVLSRGKEITDVATNGSQLAAVDQDGSCRIFSPDGDVLATYQLELPAKSLDIASYLKDPWGLYSVAFAGDAVLAGDGFGRIHRLV